MITVRQYAEQKGISHQAVYKMLKTHVAEIEEYVAKEGNVRYLTEEAVAILDKYRESKTQIIERTDDKERIEELEGNIKLLLQREVELSLELREVYKLQAEQAYLIADAKNTAALLEESRSIRKVQQDEILTLKEEVKEQKNKIEQLQEELTTERNKTWVKKLLRR